jgi:hypothetical protein
MRRLTNEDLFVSFCFCFFFVLLDGPHYNSSVGFGCCGVLHAEELLNICQFLTSGGGTGNRCSAGWSLTPDSNGFSISLPIAKVVSCNITSSLDGYAYGAHAVSGVADFAALSLCVHITYHVI